MPAHTRRVPKQRVLSASIHHAADSSGGGAREADGRFSDLLQNVELVAMTLDARGAVTFCNDYLLRLTGWKHEEVLGVDWFAHFIPDPGGEASRVFSDSVATGALPRHFENPIRTRHRGLRHIRWHNTVLRDGQGHVTGMASIGEDVTERKLAENARRESEERMNIIFRSAPIAISCSTPDGAFVEVNEQLAALWGYRRDELIGRTVQELNLWEHVADRAPVMEQLKRDGVVLNHPVRFRRKSGELCTTLLSMQRLQFSDQPLYIAMIVDVTRQKAMEAQLKHAERMECIGRLASGIAHDMNNILAPIMMAAPLLRMPLPPDDREKMLAQIETGAKRGADLIKQLMTLGRGNDAKHGTIDLARLIAEVGKMSGETFPKSIAVQVVLAPDFWTVHGNPAQLHQVMLNLCINARDAMPNGGRLNVTGCNLRADVTYAAMHGGVTPGEYVRITVGDTGVGISPEVLPRIFDPFFTTKLPGEGTGLGLSTVSSIIKAHGGTISVRSVPGEGTTFDILLPACPSEAADVSTAEEVPPRGRGQHVLVVDDEAAVRIVSHETLARHGYRVTTAVDGADALMAFTGAREAIGVVVTDLDMPVVDGANLARVLRRLQPGVRIVLSTGTAAIAMLKRQLELERLAVSAILAKPYTAQQLLAAVNAAMHPTARI